MSAAMLWAGWLTLSLAANDFPTNQSFEDERCLRIRGPEEVATLVTLFRRYSLTPEECTHISAQIQQLNQLSYRKREKAQAQLHQARPAAMVLFRQAWETSDLELRRRLETCMFQLPERWSPAKAEAAVRLLRSYRPEKVASILWEYFPYAGDVGVEREIASALLDLHEQGLVPRQPPSRGLAENPGRSQSDIARIGARPGLLPPSRPGEERGRTQPVSPAVLPGRHLARGNGCGFAEYRRGFDCQLSDLHQEFLADVPARATGRDVCRLRVGGGTSFLGALSPESDSSRSYASPVQLPGGGTRGRAGLALAGGPEGGGPGPRGAKSKDAKVTLRGLQAQTSTPGRNPSPSKM